MMDARCKHCGTEFDLGPEPPPARSGMVYRVECPGCHRWYARSKFAVWFQTNVASEKRDEERRKKAEEQAALAARHAELMRKQKEWFDQEAAEAERQAYLQESARSAASRQMAEYSATKPTDPESPPEPYRALRLAADMFNLFASLNLVGSALVLIAGIIAGANVGGATALVGLGCAVACLLSAGVNWFMANAVRAFRAIAINSDRIRELLEKNLPVQEAAA